MNDTVLVKDNKILRTYDSENLLIEAWGENGVRVRTVRMGDPFSDNDWVLSGNIAVKPEINVEKQTVLLINGNIKVVLTDSGKLLFYNKDGKLLLEEFTRNRRDPLSKDCSALDLDSREFSPILGGDYMLTVRFESDSEERLYGMGQYQQPYLNLKGCKLELAHRNSQASVPFLLSNKGYGFLWNNPSIGEVTFGKNVTEWKSRSTRQLDYWITAADSPAEIIESYAKVSGTVPMMPEYGLGFWQCKLRYQTQDELLEIAREYKRRKLPIDVIVVDFFHWPKQGDWKFDPDYWPDPDSMIAELKEMNIELMVSIWPTVDRESDNYETMRRKGYLVRSERGVRTTMEFQAPTVFFDPTNPAAREYVWEKAKKNYYDKGINIFWLDEAEPEYSVYDFDNYRYYAGPNLRVGNLYPLHYAQTFYEGMQKEGQHNIVNLLRCAWAGSQRFGALVWSGDIASSFESMRNQLSAGLNMGLAGIPWWTTDIGGFHGGNPDDDSFRELFIRWFQWATFCPVMRLHGDREPHQPQLGTTGGCKCLSGAPNEVWSYGEKVLAICTKYMKLREKMRPYIRDVMKQAHEKGSPVMRPLFYEFPNDSQSWEIEDEYMFGNALLIAPILHRNERIRSIYLPFGSKWKEYETGTTYEGGQFIDVSAPIEQIPFFIKEGADIAL